MSGIFGINAELLIDHAWGYEPVEIKDIKAYRPESNSISSGQVLQHPYNYEKTRLIVREMTELLALNLVDKGLVTDQLVLTIGYDIENLKDETIKKAYAGDVTTDHYGRRVPKHAHGSINLPRQTASTRLMMEAVMELFERIMNPALLSRRINLTANHVIPEKDVKPVEETFEQMDLFTDYGAREKKRQQEEAELAKEKKMQKAVLDIQKKFGKNAVLKGMNLQEGGTTIERNGQVGGHRA